jgi:dUTP pyrophosphatase
MEPPVVVCASRGGFLPEYQSPGAAGADLRAFLDMDVLIRPGERVLIPTGLVLSLPSGWEAQVRPRSGLAARHGITVLNAPGTIDSDYRGELQVLLINLGSADFTVHSGDRVAQLVVSPVARASFTRAASVDTTERGSGGFGSTGI